MSEQEIEGNAVDLYHVPGSRRVIPASVANRYAYLKSVIIQRGTDYAAAMVEMWCAILETSRGGLWQAEFDNQDEWMISLSELGLPGVSRASIYDKIGIMNRLVQGGASPEMAAAMASTAPGAARVASKTLPALSDGNADKYLSELLNLTPSEALGKARYDSGQRVDIWFDEFAVHGETILARLIRKDSDGYQSFDVKITVTPTKIEWMNKIEGTLNWLLNRVRSGVQNASRFR